jgi:hypothetical protein
MTVNNSHFTRCVNLSSSLYHHHHLALHYPKQIRGGLLVLAGCNATNQASAVVWIEHYLLFGCALHTLQAFLQNMVCRTGDGRYVSVSGSCAKSVSLLTVARLQSCTGMRMPLGQTASNCRHADRKKTGLKLKSFVGEATETLCEFCDYPCK